MFSVSKGVLVLSTGKDGALWLRRVVCMLGPQYGLDAFEQRTRLRWCVQPMAGGCLEVSWSTPDEEDGHYEEGCDIGVALGDVVTDVL